MASVIDTVEVAEVSSPPSLAAFIDRWIFVFMAGLFIVTVLVGFVPTSVQKVMEVQVGVRPPLPAILHVHAVLMGSWMLLLLAQTVLMATGRSAWHKQLGVAGMVIMPAMVVAGILLVPTMAAYNFVMLDAAPPEALPPGYAVMVKGIISNIFGGQIMVGILFPLFVGRALIARKTDSGLHKRLMILASALPIGAAVDRMAWLPNTMPDSPLGPFSYTVVLILPMLIWDLVRNRSLHRAYVAWFALYIPSTALVMYLWNKPWWIEFAQTVLGVRS